MKRIDTATKAEDLFGAGKHGFKDGNVLTGEQPTVLNADWFNHIQEELAAVVEVVIGTALDPNARNQIATGLAAIIATLAPKASPAFTGNPTAPTQSAGNNSTLIATTEFVQAALAALVDAAPGALDTLSELAAALGDDPNFATTITNLIATKLSLAGGTLTGFLTLHAAPTSNLHAATKEYVDEVRVGLAPLASPAFTGTPTAPTPAQNDDSAQVSTTAWGKSISLGWGQAWQDVTGSRAANTPYPNTTGKPIIVSVFVGAIGATRALSVSADDVNWVEVANTTTGGGTMQAVVPPEHYCKMNGSFGQWRELR